MTSKELRGWLEERGVAVVTTRTRPGGMVMATSCFFYGAGGAHVFRTGRGFGGVTGYRVDEFGREQAVGFWPLDHAGKIEKTPQPAAQP